VNDDIQFPLELPICARLDEIEQTIQQHQVIVLSGETGSGKTTQIPKICLKAGLGQKRKIACTQPRRVAALSVAKRVAEELKVEFGAEVGAKIRFTDKTSRRTRIKFMTDGMLLSETQSDPTLREYDTIIVDEAHERSLNIDFLLGHLNQLRARRPDLKIIITSATIDTKKFSDAFDQAPIIEVSGRTYPVETIHAPLDELLEDSGEFTFVEGIAEATQRIVDEFGRGDILAFLPTEKDIRESMDLLEGRYGRRMEILPCFGRLSNADQQRIFSPSSRRKLILATNIAETSLTIPGIRFVIDTGLARISRYNPRGRTQRLPIVKVAQSSANQRKGRCGRVEDGICIRLYSESDYESRPEFSIPEIQRSNLADVILRMKAARLGDVETFPFIDPPSPQAITSGYKLLQEIGALDEERSLTPIGRKLSALPVDPTVGRMLIEAEKKGVVEQVLVIASALSIPDPRDRPMDQQAAARSAHAAFEHPDSDFLTLLNIWESYHGEFERLSQSRQRRFCKKHFVSYLRMREWRDIHDQLKKALIGYEKQNDLHPNSFQHANLDEQKKSRGATGPEYEAIHKSLLSGLLINVARKEQTNQYQAAANRKPMIFPGSSLFIKQANPRKGQRTSSVKANENRKKGPAWILSGEIVETSRLYARNIAIIDPAWISEIGAHLLSYSYSDPIFDPQEGRVAARESIRIHGLEIRAHRVSYLKVDRAKATEIFIREALLNEDYELEMPFLEANRKLKNRIQNAQTTTQISSWMGIEEAAYRFYESKLEAVASIHDLNRFLKSRDGRNGSFLQMSESDLLADASEKIDMDAFPEKVTLENELFPIEYVYAPGEENDGVTLKLPIGDSSALDSPMLDWLVPGHLEVKVLHLIRALPKDTRRPLQPLNTTAKAIAQKLRPTDESLLKSLARYLETEYGIETYASDWNESTLPPHLKTRVQVVNTKGETVAEGRDPDRVRERIREQQAALAKSKPDDTRGLWAAARKEHQRSIEALCDLGAITPAIEIGRSHGVPLRAYPGLRASGDALRIHLFDSEEDARHANLLGIERLLEIELRRELAWIESDLKEVERVGPVAVVFRPINELKKDVYQHIKKELCSHNLDTINSKQIQDVLQKAIQRSKGILYKVVDQLVNILNLRQQLVVDPNLYPRYQEDIDRLLPPDFLQRTPFPILTRFPVYLNCILKRNTKRIENPERDEKRFKTVERFRRQFASLEGKEIPRWTAKLSELKWMIEEFALSVFAQELGTAYPVSAKKLEGAFSKFGSNATPPTIAAASPRKNEKSATHAKPKDKPTKADLESLKKLFG